MRLKREPEQEEPFRAPDAVQGVQAAFGKTQTMRWNDLSWLKSNRPLLIAEIIAVPLVIAWFLFFYFDTHDAFALVLLFLLPVFAVANLVILNRSRSRLADAGARRDSLTGDVATPSPIQWSPSTQQLRWTGAVDVPGSMGRMNASAPLGVLELTGGRLALRVRPTFVATLFGARALVVTPADVEAVFPARAKLRYRGIGIRPIGEPPSYFITRGADRGAILSATAAAGFPVQWEERNYSYS